jgi:hypothetical protein
MSWPRQRVWGRSVVARVNVVLSTRDMRALDSDIVTGSIADADPLQLDLTQPLSKNREPGIITATA